MSIRLKRCLSIPGPRLDEVEAQICAAQHSAQLIELRFDLFAENALKHLPQWMKCNVLPTIFTLRHRNEAMGEQQRYIRALAQFQPTYLDLAWGTPLSFLQELKRDFPTVKHIISYHDFHETPECLEELYAELTSLPGDLYKIACMAKQTQDALRMVELMRHHPQLLGMCMGERGEITRILGGPWTYTTLSATHQTAPGQLTALELNAYNTPARHLYGLIGDPVSQSIGHKIHNEMMRACGVDGVYVKMVIRPEELAAFFTIAHRLNMKGLSVTMPLKECVIPYLDDIDAEARHIGAVNTIVFHQGRSMGYNTDGKGALDAIEVQLPVLGKKILVLGAGGAARAIVYEAAKRGAYVEILNRTTAKAQSLANYFGVAVLESPPVDYDVLINATSDACPIPPAYILPHRIVMDIKTCPVMTGLLQIAQEKKCTLLFGYEMFINQALAQDALWFPHEMQAQSIISSNKIIV